MTRRRWWGAPLDLGKPAHLRRLDQLFSQDEPPLVPAQPLTVRVRGFMLREDEDWAPRGHNDIIVASTFQCAGEPPVQRLHLLQNELPLGWHGALFHDTVLSVRDLDAAALTLRVQIYDVDQVSEDLVQQITEAASSAAVAFPHLARYAAGVSMLAPGLIRLIDELDDHDPILDQRVKLEAEAPGTGHALLQPGYFVCFRNEVESGWHLDQDLRVVRGDDGGGAEGGEYADGSYVVLEVARSFQAHHDWEIDQKIAKLIAELDGKGSSGKAALEFLRETLDAYGKFRRLERARALRDKASRSPAEDALLDELCRDQALAPYLSGKG